MSKCEFSMQEMLYLGHVIGANGVQVHLEKIRAILDWPTPKNVTELRGFWAFAPTIGGMSSDSHR